MSAGYISTDVDAGTAKTTYTYSSQAIGTADADRTVIVMFGGLRDTSGTYVVSSVTIGGVSATRVYSSNVDAVSF